MATGSRRWPLVAGAVVGVLLVIAGAATAYFGYEQSDGPDGAVRSYFAALRAGDAPRALSWGELPAGPHTLLTSSVLKTQQAIAPIADVGIDRVDRRGAHAVVQVRYRLDFPAGAVPVTASVDVDEHGGGWRLRRTAVLTQMLMTAAGNRATVAGGRVPQTDVLLFPGAVPITFDSPYLQLDPGTDTVGFGAPSQLDVAVDVSPAGRSAIRAAVGAALDSCVQASSPAPSCPLPSDRYVPGSLHGTVQRSSLEGLTITLGNGADGVISADGTVGFTGTFRKLAFDNVATAGHGSVGLQVHADAYAVQPLTVRWTT